MSYENETFPTNCTVDADCDPYSTNRMCYAGASWLEDNQSECLCNNYYGWEGLDCTEYGIGTFLSMLFFGSLALTCLGFFVHCIHVLVQRSRNSPTSPYIPLTAANTTTMFLSCALLSAMSFSFATVLSFGANEGTPDEFYVTNKDGFGRYEWWSRNVFSPATGLFVVMAQLNLCLMWIDISSHAKNLKPIALQNLGKSRKIIIYTQITMVVFMALGLIGTTISGIVLIAYVSIPFPIICAYLYIRGAREMTALLTRSTSTLGNSTEQTTNFNKFVATLNKVTRRVVFCDVYFILALLAYSLIQGDSVIRELSVAGQWFTFEKFLHHSNFFALTFSSFVLWEYLRSTSAAKRKTAENGPLAYTENVGTFEYSQDNNGGSFNKGNGGSFNREQHKGSFI